MYKTDTMKKHVVNEQTDRVFSIFLFVFGLLVALLFINTTGTGDFALWLKWMKTLHMEGLVSSYEMINDNYPPLVYGILLVVDQLSHLLNIEPSIALKLSLWASLALACCVFAWRTRSIPFGTMLIFCLLLNSVALGYLDIYWAVPFILGMFDLKDGKILQGNLWFTIAIFIKWQPLIILPHVMLYVLLRPGAFGERVPRFIHAFLMIAVPMLIVFSFLYYIFGTEIVISFYKALQHPYLSANALNFGWLSTYFLHSYAPNLYGPLREGGNYIVSQSVSQSVFIVHKGLFILFYFFSLFAFLRVEKTFRNLVLFSLLGYLAYFEFNTGVHENHLFLSVLLASYLLLWGYSKPFSFLAVL